MGILALIVCCEINTECSMEADNYINSVRSSVQYCKLELICIVGGDVALLRSGLW